MEAGAGEHSEVTAALLEAGTPWNATDKQGSCASDLAVAGGHESTAELLLEAGRLFLHSTHGMPCNFFL